MPIVNKKITGPEIAAIWYHVFSGSDNWREIYAMADGIKDPEQIEKINRSTIYQWRNSEKVQKLIREAERAKFELIQAERAKGIEEGKKEIIDSVHTNSATSPDVPKYGTSKFVDYSDPRAQRDKLNQLVNTADDPGEALDALKVIISSQKADREAAKEGKVARAYLPETCDACPLYQKARKKGVK